VSSVLKNETVIETPRDVDGVLDLCHVLIKDQGDAAPTSGVGAAKEIRRQGPHFPERDDVVEEQGWLARMVHLFRAESLDVQFEVGEIEVNSCHLLTDHPAMQLLQTARKHFEAGGERMRYTFPALITSSIKLCRRFKNREHLVISLVSIRGRV